MMIEYKLDFFKFHKFPDTTIADGEIIQQLQRFGDNLLTPSPILQICNAAKIILSFSTKIYHNLCGKYIFLMKTLNTIDSSLRPSTSDNRRYTLEFFCT